MGFYPVEPTRGTYVIGSPVFRKVILHLAGGDFTIEARNASEKNIYIQSASLNGRALEALDKAYFYHSDIKPAGRLIFEMEPEPKREWASEPDAAPPSLTPYLLQP